MLLCAEEDDLALVQWVHAARERGLAPEIVTGVEHDDAPLLDALDDVDCGLFVVLRSEYLDAARMRAIKSAFGRHRRAEQRLFALRLDMGAVAAIDRIAGELAGGPRARSETSMVIAIDDLFGPDGGEFVELRAPVAAPPTSTVPSVDRALRLGARAVEHEVTAQFEIGDETIPMLPSSVPEVVAPSRRAARSRRTPLLAALGLAGAAAGFAAIVAVTASSDVTAATTATTEPAAIAPATLATAPIANAEPGPPAEPEPARAPLAEAPVVIRVQAEPEPEVILTTEVEAPRSTAPRHRVARRTAASPAPPPAITPPPDEVAVAAPASVDALPSEPAPLEAPPVAPAITATPDPQPSASAAEPTPPAPPAP